MFRSQSLLFYSYLLFFVSVYPSAMFCDNWQTGKIIINFLEHFSIWHLKIALWRKKINGVSSSFLNYGWNSLMVLNYHLIVNAFFNYHKINVCKHIQACSQSLSIPYIHLFYSSYTVFIFLYFSIRTVFNHTAIEVFLETLILLIMYSIFHLGHKIKNIVSCVRRFWRQILCRYTMPEEKRNETVVL